MKGVPIKFRGKDKNGYLFGSHHILKDGSHVIIDEGSWYYGRVYSDTIVQLVGYDIDGNEVYEGNVIFDAEHNDTLNAELYPSVHLQYYQVIKEDNNESSAV